METRQERGLYIAATYKIVQRGGKWIVPSQSVNGRRYTVVITSEHESCNCPDHEITGQKCKHIIAAQYTYEHEFDDDGNITQTETLTLSKTRKSYSQDWRSYNAAQTSEKAQVQALLHDLCKAIPESTETRLGRPRLPVRDGIFSACLKVYSQLSSRRFQSDLRDAHEKGFISKTPHFNSVLNVFDNEETTPLLKSLVEQSATPLATLENTFAVDSSGFSSCKFDQWYATKWKDAEDRIGRVWVKAHIMVGCATNVITAAEVLPKGSADAPLLPSLMQTTAQHFTLGEICADKAYLSESNLRAISEAGSSAMIPFKMNSQPSRPGVWNDAYHYFHLHREEFLARYHQRSNVESTFSAVKRKFGDAVRAKNHHAMINEVYAKFICYNLSCVVHAMEELGIDANFGCTKTLSAAHKLSAV